MDEKLDLTALTKAIDSLKIALDEYARDESNEFVRDSCIQRFEYCYDLATKMIKRYLTMAAANPSEVQEMTFSSQIREAYTKDIIKNSWDKWTVYRNDRNKTSHSYSLKAALEIMDGLDVFYDELSYLLAALQDKNED